MITPNKHLNLESSVINVSTTILKILNESSPMKYDDLFSAVKYQNGEKAKINFLAALDFLYLLKKVKFLKTIDSFELIK